MRSNKLDTDKVAKQINYVNKHRNEFNRNMVVKDNYGNYESEPYGRHVNKRDRVSIEEIERQRVEYNRRMRKHSVIADILLTIDVGLTILVLVYNVSSWIWLIINTLMVVFGVRLNNVKTVRFATISLVILLCNIAKILYEIGVFKLLDKLLFK